MAASFSDAAAEAAHLALRVCSGTADAISFAAGLTKELPVIGPVLDMLRAIHATVGTLNNNREELEDLGKRCTYVTTYVIVKCRQSATSAIEAKVAPLEAYIKTVEKFVDRCSARGKSARGKIKGVVNASSDKDEIERLKEGIRDLEADLNVACIVSVEGKTDVLKEELERVRKNQDIMMAVLPKREAKRATVPKGTPLLKSWHVERRHVVNTVFEALTRDGGTHLVGLVGNSGAGKTTAAAEVVRSSQVQEAFSDGILWLTVNDGAKRHLSLLMLQLARMVYEDIGDNVGRCPTTSDDGVMYIQDYIQRGHAGRGLRCLVVADNVWEEEVVSKLLETGMSVLLSTRDEDLVTSVQGEAVRVDKLSEADAESLLRNAAELPPEARSPDDAVDLVRLCGSVAMDVAFVGRWSNVRRQEGRQAWSDAASKIRAEINAVAPDSRWDSTENAHAVRRKAILRAGFDNLATGVDDERVQRLYLSLAVMPDGHAFTTKDAAVLLDDREFNAELEKSVAQVVEVLERWSVVRAADGKYFIHDAHLSFARESLMDHGYVGRPAVRRWVKHISSLAVLRSFGPNALKGLWLAVERVGGPGWDTTRPYASEINKMFDAGSDSVQLREDMEALADFQQVQEDWEGSSTTLLKLLEMEKRDLGEHHPNVINSYGALATCARRLKKDHDAAEWRKTQLEALPLSLAKTQKQVDAGEIEGLDGAGTLTSLASTVLALAPGDRDEAEKLLRQSLKMQEDELGQENAKLAGTLYQLAVCVRDAGRLDEANELLGRCLRIEDFNGDEKEGELANTLLNFGACLRLAGRWDEAEEKLTRCLEIQEAEYGSVSTDLTGPLVNLAVCAQAKGQLEKAERLFRRCLEILEAKAGPDDLLVASRLYELAACVGSTGRLEEAKKLLRRRLRILESKLGVDHLKVATTLHLLGVYVQAGEREAGRQGEAEGLLRRCLTILEAKLGPDDSQVASRLYELAACIRAAGRLEEATELMKRRLRILESIWGSDHPKVVATLHELGGWAREAGRWEEAEQSFNRCLEIQEAKSGPESEDLAMTLVNLALCAQGAGRLVEAEGLFRRCLTILEAKLGPDDTQVASRLYELAACIRAAGRLEEATELMKRRLRILESSPGSDNGRVARTLHELGVWAREAGRWEEAEQSFNRYLEIQEAKSGPESEDLAMTLVNLALCAQGAGRLVEAEGLFRRCLAILEAKLGPDDTQVASRLYELAVFVHETGRLEEATELMKRRLRILESSPGSDNGRVARTLHELGVWAREAGRWEEAEESLRRCLRILEADSGLDDALMTSTLNQLVRCVVYKAGRLREAEELLRRPLNLLKAKHCRDNTSQASLEEFKLMRGFEIMKMMMALSDLAEYVREKGRLDEAERLIKLSQWQTQLDLEGRQEEEMDVQDGERMTMRRFPIRLVAGVSPFFLFAVFFGGISHVVYSVLERFRV